MKQCTHTLAMDETHVSIDETAWRSSVFDRQVHRDL